LASTEVKIFSWLEFMMQSPLLEFESSAFPVESGEDEFTNPGVYGKSLASWLAAQLALQGHPVGDVFAEDFGWCIPLMSKPHALYVACASTAGKTSEWHVFVFAEGGFVARLFGKDTRSDAIASLFGTIRHVLQDAACIGTLHEHSL
jgi:hypothetical protein